MADARTRAVDELDLQTANGSSARVGRPVLRYGGADRTSGAQRFVADLSFPGAAHVALVTVPVGCAEILGVDSSAASVVPGPVEVATAPELPSPIPRFGTAPLDGSVLAADRVNFHGEPVAAV